LKKKVAEILLNTQAVKLNVNEPFIYTSGIRSPIYCDNRILIGKRERSTIIKFFLKELEQKTFEVIVGTATAGIPWATFLADRLDKPLAYVRSKRKKHGKTKMIEGANVKNKKIVLIEDLISTGGSSLRAVQNLRKEGAIVDEIFAIFSYQFKSATKNAKENNVNIITLSDFSTLLQLAKQTNFINNTDYKYAMQWNSNPEEWYKSNRFINLN